MGKSPISMAIFHCILYVHQRVSFYSHRVWSLPFTQRAEADVWTSTAWMKGRAAPSGAQKAPLTRGSEGARLKLTRVLWFPYNTTTIYIYIYTYRYIQLHSTNKNSWQCSGLENKRTKNTDAPLKDLQTSPVGMIWSAAGSACQHSRAQSVWIAAWAGELDTSAAPMFLWNGFANWYPASVSTLDGRMHIVTQSVGGLVPNISKPLTHDVTLCYSGLLNQIKVGHLKPEVKNMFFFQIGTPLHGVFHWSGLSGKYLCCIQWKAPVMARVRHTS